MVAQDEAEAAVSIAGEDIFFCDERGQVLPDAAPIGSQDVNSEAETDDTEPDMEMLRFFQRAFKRAGHPSADEVPEDDGVRAVQSAPEVDAETDTEYDFMDDSNLHQPCWDVFPEDGMALVVGVEPRQKIIELEDSDREDPALTSIHRPTSRLKLSARTRALRTLLQEGEVTSSLGRSYSELVAALRPKADAVGTVEGRTPVCFRMRGARPLVGAKASGAVGVAPTSCSSNGKEVSTSSSSTGLPDAYASYTAPLVLLRAYCSNGLCVLVRGGSVVFEEDAVQYPCSTLVPLHLDRSASATPVNLVSLWLLTSLRDRYEAGASTKVCDLLGAKRLRPRERVNELLEFLLGRRDTYPLLFNSTELSSFSAPKPSRLPVPASIRRPVVELDELGQMPDDYRCRGKQGESKAKEDGIRVALEASASDADEKSSHKMAKVRRSKSKRKLVQERSSSRRPRSSDGSKASTERGKKKPKEMSREKDHKTRSRKLKGAAADAIVKRKIERKKSNRTKASRGHSSSSEAAVLRTPSVAKRRKVRKRVRKTAGMTALAVVEQTLAEEVNGVEDMADDKASPSLSQALQSLEVDAGAKTEEGEGETPGRNSRTAREEERRRAVEETEEDFGSTTAVPTMASTPAPLDFVATSAADVADPPSLLDAPSMAGTTISTPERRLAPDHPCTRERSPELQNDEPPSKPRLLENDSLAGLRADVSRAARRLTGEVTRKEHLEFEHEALSKLARELREKIMETKEDRGYWRRRAAYAEALAAVLQGSSLGVASPSEADEGRGSPAAGAADEDLLVGLWDSASKV